MVEQAFPDPYVVGNDMVLSSGKFIVLATMIREFVMIQKQKVIVFAGFDQALNLCEDLLEHIQDSGRGFEYARIDGRTSSAWRNLGIYLFNNDPKYKVFLISIRAGGEGLNLSSASTVIFLDEDWNPQVMRQAEARVHRIGQKKQVRVFKMYSRGTIEEQMVCRLAKKTYLAEKVTEKLKTLKSLNELAAVVEQDAVSNNANGSTTVIASFLASLIRQRRLAENPIDVKKLLSWGWEAVLEVCGDGQKNELETPEDIPEDMELEWLRSKEHIRTNVFNGVRIKKAPRNAGPEDPPQTPRADRRIGKERIVELEGYQVTKENLRLGSCEASPRSPTTPSRKDPIVHDRVSLNPRTLILVLTVTRCVSFVNIRVHRKNASPVLGTSIRSVSLQSSVRVHTRPCSFVQITIASDAKRQHVRSDNCCIVASHVSEHIARSVWTGLTRLSLEPKSTRT